jgi:hypothetical protein
MTYSTSESVALKCVSEQCLFKASISLNLVETVLSWQIAPSLLQLASIISFIRHCIVHSNVQK